jgi:hypothetical protein
MTHSVTPKSTLVPTAPAVGIFWRVSDALVIDRSSLDEAETYGDCVTHAVGHYQRWQEWQEMGAARLAAKGYPIAIMSTEYDEWPRGRIVYQTLQDCFVLYADRRLQRPEIIEAIKQAFGLRDVQTVIRSDSHYRL